MHKTSFRGERLPREIGSQDNQELYLLCGDFLVFVSVNLYCMPMLVCMALAN